MTIEVVYSGFLASGEKWSDGELHLGSANGMHPGPRSARVPLWHWFWRRL